VQLAELVTASAEVAATRSRLRKRSVLSACLRRAAADGELPVAVSYLTGTLPQGRIGLGFANVRGLGGAASANAPALTLGVVDSVFERIAATRGKGSQGARQAELAALFARATAAESDFLIRLIVGELRQGALEGVLIDAIADAAGLDVADVRRAVMLAGELPCVAEVALGEGSAGLARFRLRPLTPIQPMLAQPATDMGAAIASLGEAALEYKLDGARVQIHKVGSEVRIFSRRLNDVTASLPDIVAAAAACPARVLILDGEVVALRDDGRPHPFQVTMSRFGRKSDVAAMARRLPLSVFLFDCLHHDGADLIDSPGVERFEHLAAAGAEHLTPRVVTGDERAAQEFLEKALAAGHEGVMAKSLHAPYQAGARGGDWLKVKPAHTLDLVVLAAEWGSGRRRGWLSNLHLGARDQDSGGYVMLGKTFKGLTDELLEWQTRKLLALEIRRDGHVVHVRPELVVEIAVNQIQTSPQYPAGMALRFARVKRYREDKPAGQTDTIATVRDLHARQTE
jgi:ATP-dependent DNA ligase I